MGFTTPLCARPCPDWRLSASKCAAIRTAICALAVAACGPAPTSFGFSLKSIESRASGENLHVLVHQEIDLSREARNALDHGVPLTVRVDLALGKAGSRQKVMQAEREFEIRYLPLSDHYQLSSDDGTGVKTYPRLRHVLAEMSTVDMTLRVGKLSPGEFELRARSFLDKTRMPPPMRLPGWFSPQWKHDSGWQAWPVVINADSLEAGA